MAGTYGERRDRAGVPRRSVYPAPGAVKFVPVLVGSFGQFVAQGRSTKGDERVEGFIEALNGRAADL